MAKITIKDVAKVIAETEGFFYDLIPHWKQMQYEIKARKWTKVYRICKVLARKE